MKLSLSSSRRTVSVKLPPSSCCTASYGCGFHSRSDFRRSTSVGVVDSRAITFASWSIDTHVENSTVRERAFVTRQFGRIGRLVSRCVYYTSSCYYGRPKCLLDRARSCLLVSCVEGRFLASFNANGLAWRFGRAFGPVDSSDHRYSNLFALAIRDMTVFITFLLASCSNAGADEVVFSRADSCRLHWLVVLLTQSCC